MANETYIVDAVRTPTGRHGGSGLATLCIGVGQGLALSLERV